MFANRGVSSMTSSISPWSALRPLRSVLIAGAAAVAWLSFSAPAADASAQQGQDSLLGGITAPAASASNGTNNPGIPTRALTAIDPAVPAAQPDVSTVPVLAAPSKATPSGAAPAPVAAAEYMPSLAGEIIAPVEAAANTGTSSEVVPAQGASPVASLSDMALDRGAETVSQSVATPATEAATVLASPLRSISEVVSRVPSLLQPAVPVLEVLEEVDSAVAAGVIEALPATPNSGQAEGATQSAPPTADTAPGNTGIRDGLSSVDSNLLGAFTPGTAAPSILAPYGKGGTPAEDDNRLDPVLPILPPGSGSVNGQSSGAPFASAAWLTSLSEHLPPTGLLPVGGPLQHIPSPIALEPGSSPD